MADDLQLHQPWLIAVWPGMGSVAFNAGVYLLSKLEMTLAAEFDVSDLFDVDHVDVSNGIIRQVRRPRQRLFVWRDPARIHDLVVFLGEAQPPVGKYNFCRQLIQKAQLIGVERVFTFAAMASGMRPEHRSRVFIAATNEQLLQEMKNFDLEVLETGNIGGLNGVLLGASAEVGLPGACLLGEMPHIFAQLPFPNASLRILEAFARLTELHLDMSELAERGRIMEQHMQEILSQVEKVAESRLEGEEESYESEVQRPGQLAAVEESRLEQLFADAAKDRSKAFELKQELDRLDVFSEYEDRFLDLFKKSD